MDIYNDICKNISDSFNLQEVKILAKEYNIKIIKKNKKELCAELGKILHSGRKPDLKLKYQIGKNFKGLNSIRTFFHNQIIYITQLSTDIQSSIIDYTRYFEGLALKLNKCLRDNAPLSNKCLIIKNNLDIAFENVPPIHENIITWRGIKSDKYNTELPRSYMSTSLQLNKVKYFTNPTCCLLRIFIPAGSRVLPLIYHSEETQEHEILLPMKGRFVVTNITIVSKHKELRSKLNHMLEPSLKVYDLTYIPETNKQLLFNTPLIESIDDVDNIIAQIAQIIELDEYISEMFDTTPPDIVLTNILNNILYIKVSKEVYDRLYKKFIELYMDFLPRPILERVYPNNNSQYMDIYEDYFPLLEIITLNINAFEGNGQTNITEKTSIKEFIKLLNDNQSTDIICLQEYNTIINLQEIIESKTNFKVYSCLTGEEWDNIVLATTVLINKKSTWKVTNAKCIKPKHLGYTSRAFNLIKLRNYSLSINLNVVNVHFIGGRFDDQKYKDDLKNNKQILARSKHIKHIMKEINNIPTIILGDTNIAVDTIKAAKNNDYLSDIIEFTLDGLDVFQDNGFSPIYTDKDYAHNLSMTTSSCRFENVIPDRAFSNISDIDVNAEVIDTCKWTDHYGIKFRFVLFKRPHS